MLLRDLPQNPFSTVSVKLRLRHIPMSASTTRRHSRGRRRVSTLPSKADIPGFTSRRPSLRRAMTLDREDVDAIGDAVARGVSEALGHVDMAAIESAIQRGVTASRN